MKIATLFDHSRVVVAAALASAIVVCAAATARADSTPIGMLPAGSVASSQTHVGQLVAVALPRSSAASGLVWRIARPFNGKVVQEASEADVGTSVVLVFRVVGSGDTSLVFALTRGDTSATAVKSSVHHVHATA